MIHIIDPRTQMPTPDFTSERRAGQPTAISRYVRDRDMHCASLVAVRTDDGRYYIAKNRLEKPKPGSIITSASLKRCLAQVLKFHG